MGDGALHGMGSRGPLKGPWWGPGAMPRWRSRGWRSRGAKQLKARGFLHIWHYRRGHFKVQNEKKFHKITFIKMSRIFKNHMCTHVLPLSPLFSPSLSPSLLLKLLFFTFLANKWGCDTPTITPHGDGPASSSFLLLLVSSFPSLFFSLLFFFPLFFFSL